VRLVESQRGREGSGRGAGTGLRKKWRVPVERNEKARACGPGLAVRERLSAQARGDALAQPVGEPHGGLSERYEDCDGDEGEPAEQPEREQADAIEGEAGDDEVNHGSVQLASLVQSDGEPMRSQSLPCRLTHAAPVTRSVR